MSQRHRTLEEVRPYFYIAMRHFGHSEAQQREAWLSVKRYPNQAYACYRAIANSL